MPQIKETILLCVAYPLSRSHLINNQFTAVIPVGLVSLPSLSPAIFMIAEHAPVYAAPGQARFFVPSPLILGAHPPRKKPTA
jgi:hypothetical protein